MTKNTSTAAVSALILMTGLSVQVRAEEAPTCRQWQQQKLSTKTCVCAGRIMRGDDRTKECVEASPAGGASVPGQASPQAAVSQRIGEAVSMAQELSFDNSAGSKALPDAPKPQKEAKFGFKSLTVDGGYITGADGSGKANGSVALEFYRQKTKAGTLSGEVELGRYRMGGIPINDRQDLGVIGQLPDGTPIEGTAITTGRSPAVNYIPFANFKYQPPLKLGRVHPYAVAELGMSLLSSVNAKVDTKIVASVGGQTVGVQDMGTSLQPTGEGINHMGGGFGGGAKIDLTKSGRVQFDSQFIDAPTGYKVLKYGLTYQLGKKK